MTAFNVVRFRTKPAGARFIDAHRTFNAAALARRRLLVRTGDRTFCAWSAASGIPSTIS